MLQGQFITICEDQHKMVKENKEKALNKKVSSNSTHPESP